MKQASTLMRRIGKTALAAILMTPFSACAAPEYTELRRLVLADENDATLVGSLRYATANASHESASVRGLSAAVRAQSALAYLQLAESASFEGATSKAISFAEKAREAHRGCESTQEFLADIYTVSAQELFGTAKYSASIAQLNRALSTLKNHAEANANLPIAKWNLSCQEYDAGIEEAVSGTKLALLASAKRFDSADKSVRGFLDAEAMADECRRRAAERMYAEAVSAMVAPGDFNPALALELCRKASQVFSEHDDDGLIELCARIAEVVPHANMELSYGSEHEFDQRLRDSFDISDRLGGLEPHTYFEPIESYNAFILEEWESIRSDVIALGRDEFEIPEPVNFEVLIKVDRTLAKISTGKSKSKKSKFLHSRKWVANPKKAELKAKISDAEDLLVIHIATKDLKQALVDEIDNVFMQAVAKGALSAAVGTVQSTQAKLDRLNTKFSEAPEQILVDDIRDYKYQEREITKTGKVTASITVEKNGIEVAKFKVSDEAKVSDTRRTGVKDSDHNKLANITESLPDDEEVINSAFYSFEEKLRDEIVKVRVAHTWTPLSTDEAEVACMKKVLSAKGLENIERPGSSMISSLLMEPMLPSDSYPLAEALQAPSDLVMKSWGGAAN